MDQAGGMEKKERISLEMWFFVSLKELRGKGIRQSLVKEE